MQEAGDASRFRHSGSSQPTGKVMKAGGQVALESDIDPVDDSEKNLTSTSDGAADTESV